MASAKELREMIAMNRETLKQAFESAGAKWEETLPDDEWSPRRIAEHAVGQETTYANRAAGILGGNPVPTQEWTFENAQAAVEALTKIGPEADKRYAWAEDRDLPKSDGTRTLQATMESAANHLMEHVEQLKKAM
jgi:hypothetical protein